MNNASVPMADREIVERLLDYPSLIDAIRAAFLHPPTTPERLAIPVVETDQQPGGTVLVMPSLRSGGLLGVKIITIQPTLTERPGGATRAIYVALDAKSGELKGLIDGHALTLRRTAATSILASQALARPNPQTVLVIGTGSLAKSLARAYAAVFRPQELFVWGRRESKAQAFARELGEQGIFVRPAADLSEAISSADIITSATLARDAVIPGCHVRAGTHVDLVGGFTREMREADDDLVARAAAVVADVESTILGTGDLAQPLESGLLKRSDIRTLKEVLAGTRKGRNSSGDITLFKSAGHALEDLAAAELLFQRWKI